MPALGFQKQFVPMIEDGSKHHTIRRKRKNPIKVGDVLYLYTGMRTKQCRLIKEVTCTAVVPIKIMPGTGIVRLGDTTLTEKTLEVFATNDGFSDVHSFFEFFKIYPMYILLLELEVIYWRS